LPRPPVRLLAPNAVTAANIASGFSSMLAAADGRYELAVYLLLLAMTLDISDGLVARMLDATSEFGQEMDSFSDALSFGVAPAFLLQRAVLEPLGLFGIVVSVVYVLCGILRLTRFVLTTGAHDKTLRTDGVPIPVAAGYVMATVLMRDEIPPMVAAGVALLFAVLMISHWRLPNLTGRTVVTVLMLVGIVNYFALVFRPGWPTVVWWNVWNVVILVVARVQERRQLDVESGLETAD
jgi:CDP-diacylglycerol--serine O-phosphatidyltransferase